MRLTLSAPHRILATGFFALAALMLALTLRWHIPMMLWDHLDLVPLYGAWQAGNLADSGFWHPYGGHILTAAYVVLLATTKLSGGQTWLDCVANWSLLVTYAGIVMVIARETLARETRADELFLLLIAFFALYPGHLANLQWGWQIAVFLCLVGVAGAIRCLTLVSLTWKHEIAALGFAALACLSFATGFALIPTALILIALRSDQSWRRRIALAVPWIAAGLLVLELYPSTSTVHPPEHYLNLLHYSLNFLGGGISRFAPFLAPWLALIGLASGLAAFATVHRERTSLAWLGFFAFAVTAAVLVAAGRAAPFGADHAFVTRYVSFSSLFWLGWLGLVGMAAQAAPRRWTLPRTTLTAVVVILSLGNAYQMTKKAARIGAETRATAQAIRTTWPEVDPAILAEIYFDRPQVARERLDTLREMGFAPFSKRSH